MPRIPSCPSTEAEGDPWAQVSRSTVSWRMRLPPDSMTAYNNQTDASHRASTDVDSPPRKAVECARPGPDRAVGAAHSSHVAFRAVLLRNPRLAIRHALLPPSYGWRYRENWVEDIIAYLCNCFPTPGCPGCGKTVGIEVRAMIEDVAVIAYSLHPFEKAFTTGGQHHRPLSSQVFVPFM